jgi:hypothetical protein
MTDRCCGGDHTCGRDAAVRIRLLPKRADAPWCRCTVRAQVWPGVVTTTDLLACSRHLAEAKRLGRVIAETPLSDEIATITVKE